MLPNRIKDALKEHGRRGNELSEYQVRLKKLIILATKNKDFGELLDNGGFLQTVEQYNNPDIQNEQDLHRWLGILNDSGLSPENFERNNLHSINSQWLVYLAFTAARHRDSVRRQEITDAFEKKIAEFTKKIEESEGKIEKINTTADILSQSQVFCQPMQTTKSKMPQNITRLPGGGWRF